MVGLQLKSGDLMLEFSYNGFHFCVFTIICCRRVFSSALETLCRGQRLHLLLWGIVDNVSN